MSTTIQELPEKTVLNLTTVLLATRPMFLSASILPVLIGTAVGYQATGSLDVLSFMLALLAVICVNLGINVYNDVYDDINGSDHMNTTAVFPFTGGSRAIQDNVLSRKQMQQLGAGFVLFSMIFGFALFLLKGHLIFVYGIAGILLGIAYSAPPLKLASRGLGEFTIGLAVGILPVTGAAWLQTGHLSWDALLLSLPVALWVTNILLINEVPDVRADAAAEKRTLVVRFGNLLTAILHLVLNVGAVLALVVATTFNYIPLGALMLPALSLSAAIYIAHTIYKYEQFPHLIKASIKATIAIHTVNCIWLIGWLVYA